MSDFIRLLARIGDSLFPKDNPNSNIGLFGDLDDVQILEDFERKFQISISDAQAIAITNVGDLFDCVRGEVKKKGMDLGWQEFVEVFRLHSRIPISEIQRETEFYRYVSRRKK